MKKLGFISFLLTLLHTCTPIERVLIIQTGEVSEISAHSLKISGTLVDIDQAEIMEYGHCYSTRQNPSLADSVSRMEAPKKRGVFVNAIENLNSGTTYYLRAYVKTTRETLYGKITSIRTAISTGRWELLIEPEISPLAEEISPYNYAFVIGERAYFYTGYNHTGIYTNTFAPNRWERITDHPTSCNCFGFTLGNRFYSGPNRYYFYDSNINLWGLIQNYPGKVNFEADLTAFSAAGKGYMGMGAVPDGNYDYTYFNDFYAYDPNTNTWAQIADFPGSPRQRGFAFSIQGKAYVGLGKADTTYYKDVWEYDPATDQWTQKKDFPGEARAFPAFFVIGEDAYVGLGEPVESGRYLRDFWKYEPATDTWLRVADFPEARSTLASFALKGKGYVIGGYTPFGSLNFKQFQFIP